MVYILTFSLSDLLTLCSSIYVWDLQGLQSISAFQQLILLPNHAKLPKLEQFSKFISGLAEHNVSHFHSDTSRCLALLHHQMKLLFWVEFHSALPQVETQGDSDSANKWVKSPRGAFVGFCTAPAGPDVYCFHCHHPKELVLQITANPMEMQSRCMDHFSCL